MTDGDDRDDGDNEIEYIVEIPDMPEYDDQQNSESDEDETSFPSTDTLTRVASGCGCVQNCVNNIDKSLIQTHVDNLREMTKDEKELYVMGALQKINPDSKRSRYGDRKRTRYEYKYEGNSICKNAFLIIYDVRNFTLKSLIKHMAVNGNVPRVHGNSRRKPHHALSFGDVERVVKFIAAYSVENGLPQPAAPRGRDNIPPVFLPACMTKKGIHAIYAQGCQETDARTVKIRSFVGIWSQCIAHIKVSFPYFDQSP